MTTKTQLRKAALALPEVEEGTHFGMPAFKVRGKGFASLTNDDFVQLAMTEQLADEALALFPAAQRLTRSGKSIGIRVPLATINGKELDSLVEKSWSSKAPAALAKARLAAHADAANASTHALPKSIGKPATRALLAAGVTTLDDAARRTESELLALHGVGPKAIRLLRESLAELGMTLKAG